MLVNRLDVPCRPEYNLDRHRHIRAGGGTGAIGVDLVAGPVGGRVGTGHRVTAQTAARQAAPATLKATGLLVSSPVGISLPHGKIPRVP